MFRRRKKLVRLSVAAALVAISGCAWMQRPGGAPQEQMADTDVPPPMVQNCGIVTIGSPTKYACNGKTYTSFELLKLRQDWEKTHGG